MINGKPLDEYLPPPSLMPLDEDEDGSDSDSDSDESEGEFNPSKTRSGRKFNG